MVYFLEETLQCLCRIVDSLAEKCLIRGDQMSYFLTDGKFRDHFGEHSKHIQKKNNTVYPTSTSGVILIPKYDTGLLIICRT